MKTLEGRRMRGQPQHGTQFAGKRVHALWTRRTLFPPPALCGKTPAACWADEAAHPVADVDCPQCLKRLAALGVKL